jgi:type IV secretory pathway TraG/TraD family ATPase VirD4
VPAAEPPIDVLRRRLAGAGCCLYVGAGRGGPVFARPEQAALVLGPPRSGKTRGLVIPNVLAQPGAVVSASTKPDVLAATARSRADLGQCWLFDPTGTVAAPPGVRPLRWSPLGSSASWDDALLTARALVRSARPQPGDDGRHWTERAEALLAPLLHGAALDGADMRTVVRWVLRQDLDRPAAVLRAAGADLAVDVLAGLAATDHRELSGIWSTAAGTLAAYRSDRAVASAHDPNFDPRRLVHTSDTVYLCAPADRQDLVAPILVAFLETVRSGAYAAAASAAAGGGRTLPVTLALDEVANIAPLPDLPALVSEGGGQGVLTLACLQDLSQARHRWGPQADGFGSLFGVKVVLPGIADTATLELISRLCGEEEQPARSVSRSPWWSAGRGAPTVTWTTRRHRRVPFDQVSQQPPGTALVLSGAAPPARVGVPAWADSPTFAAPALPPPGAAAPDAAPTGAALPGRGRDAGRAGLDTGW